MSEIDFEEIKNIIKHPDLDIKFMDFILTSYNYKTANIVYQLDVEFNFSFKFKIFQYSKNDEIIYLMSFIKSNPNLTFRDFRKKIMSELTLLGSKYICDILLKKDLFILELENTLLEYNINEDELREILPDLGKFANKGLNPKKVIHIIKNYISQIS